MASITQTSTYTFDGHYRAEILFAGSKFSSSGDINFGLADGRIFAMALQHVNILDTLGLTNRSAELQTRLARVEQAVQVQPQLQSTLSRLRVSHQGFTDWQASLQRFDGDAEQTSQARQPQQRAEALRLLNKIDTNIYNRQQRLLLEDDTHIDSEEL